MSIFLGVDPGIHGAVAAIDQGGRFIDVWDTPITQVRRGGKMRNDYLPVQMARLLRTGMVLGGDRRWQLDDIQMVGIEHVWSHPVKGKGGETMTAVSGNSIDRGMGMWQGIIGALQLPTTEIPPATWKKAMNLQGGPENKGASIRMAQQLFPEAAEFLARQKDDGRAEALLVAEYVRRKVLAG